MAARKSANGEFAKFASSFSRPCRFIKASFTDSNRYVGSGAGRSDGHVSTLGDGCGPSATVIWIARGHRDSLNRRERRSEVIWEVMARVPPHRRRRNASRGFGAQDRVPVRASGPLRPRTCRR